MRKKERKQMKIWPPEKTEKQEQKQEEKEYEKEYEEEVREILITNENGRRTKTRTERELRKKLK